MLDGGFAQSCGIDLKQASGVAGSLWTGIESSEIYAALDFEGGRPVFILLFYAYSGI